MQEENKNSMINVRWEVGAHSSFSGKICDTLWTGITQGMYTIQFFLGSPQGYTRAKVGEEDLERSRKALSLFPLNVFTHFPYVSNLVGSTSSLAWEGDEDQDRKTRTVISGLEHELGVVASLRTVLFGKRSGVVIHPGNYKDRKVGLKKISETISKIHFPVNSCLLLENSAGQGVSLATTLEELREIRDGVEEGKRGNIGVCIDTCHLFAVGDYDISCVEEVERFFDDYDTILGLKTLTLIHLNDSETKLGSHVDRHACLGTGYIWGKSMNSLVVLLELCKKHSIPLVLETHVSDMVTLTSLSRGFDLD